jgi:hypothetical protein
VFASNFCRFVKEKIKMRQLGFDFLFSKHLNDVHCAHVARGDLCFLIQTLVVQLSNKCKELLCLLSPMIALLPLPIGHLPFSLTTFT